MGLFASRPEEPEEWAGLPSEPARAQTEAERLADAAALPDVVWGTLGGVASISIPLTPAEAVVDPAVPDPATE